MFFTFRMSYESVSPHVINVSPFLFRITLYCRVHGSDKDIWETQNSFGISKRHRISRSMGTYHRLWYVIGFNHGLPWCVKYMARGPPVTTKPDGEAGGLCGDRRPEGHVFHTSRQAMIKTYYSTSIRKNMIQNCSYFTQLKSTTTAIDDSNRQRNKLGLGCSREATAPLILIFKLLFLWLNIGRHFKEITQFHNCHSPKHTSKKYYLVINIFRKICTKITT